MFKLADAVSIAKKSMPNSNVQSYYELESMFVFLIFDDDPLEGDFDPYYSVNKNTGEFNGFSIFDDELIGELIKL